MTSAQPAGDTVRYGKGSFDISDPYPFFARMREEAGVHRVTLNGGDNAWLVTRYADARAALNDARLSKDMHAALEKVGDADVVDMGLPGPALARHMLAMDPPDHTRLRKLLLGTFTTRRVEMMRDRVQTLVDDLLDDIAAAGPDTVVDLVPSFAFPLPYTVICELLGVPEPDRRPLSEAFEALFVPGTPDGPLADARAGSKHIVEYLDHLVALKRVQPGEDLTTALVAEQEDANVTHQELCSSLFQLFVAGHDTTSSLIGNGTAALLTHPEQLAILRADYALLPTAIDEFLRWDAAVPHASFRFTTEEIEIAGVRIPAGEQVLISIATANRDPARFDKPDVLDITRTDVQHITYGHGIHYCLGAPLARLESQIAFESLLTRFPDLCLAVPASELRWNHGDGLVLRGLEALPVHPGRALPRAS